ncbi:DUF2461 domain-containing protein [Desulfobulbus sp. AH-315-M07]|nr:DUF2461 domain-containing protein [Desulfobulbus sp. AH-315-M07]
MSYFAPALFKYLRELDANNNRDWFNANKTRYEQVLKEPAISFITDFGPYLQKISPHFVADPRPVGGSLFRIYRDTRFSKDKRPYKTNTGLHFRHEVGKDAHAPGFYLHIAPGECFIGTGMWRPDTASAKAVRSAIADDAKGWKRAVNGKAFRETFSLAGESLKRPPRGFDKEHPMLEDLMRKDFMATAELTQQQVVAPGFMKEVAKFCRVGSPLVSFLCKAMKVPF